jgi:hypothetical protein
MLDMTRDTLKLVLENKLFADPGVAYRQVAIGTAGTALLLVALAYSLPVPFWVSAVLAGFVGGYAMPYLFKDIKFK